MDLPVKNASGDEVRAVEMDEAVFGVQVAQSVVHDVVRWQRARQRSGTHATLNLARMRGGGRKPFKQKGLGRARAGTRNSPLWVGGAVIFGPQPRDYSYRMPSKMKRKALLGSLSEKARSGAVTVLDGLGFETPKTRKFVELLGTLNLRGGEGRDEKILFLFSEGEEAAAISARNIAGVSCLQQEGLNVYDLVHADRLLMSEKTLKAVQERLKGQIENSKGSRKAAGEQ
ncbi:50S ribosomal protein L4 [bacterium]|nr:50S ribosomal protein L4 [bacterium]